MILGRGTRRVLKGTELTLQTYGWTHDRYGNQHVGYCLTGAVHRASHWYNPIRRSRAYRALYRQLRPGTRLHRLPVPMMMGVMYENDKQLRSSYGALRVVRAALGEEP